MTGPAKNASLKHGSNLAGVARCPHCAIAKPLMKLLWNPGDLETREIPDHVRHWSVYQCSACLKLVLAQSHFLPKDIAKTVGGQSFLESIETVWPELPRAADELPPSAQNYLNQAYECLSAPDAATVMAASAVDSMLKAIGYQKGNLYTRIDQAVTDHKLTQEMGQWAHQVRLDANDVRHADPANPHLTLDQARQAVEFAAALGEFLFVLSARVTRGLKAAGVSTPTP